MPKIVHFGEFMKTQSLRSNSVSRQVNFERTKIGKKCQNSKSKMSHFFQNVCIVSQVYIYLKSPDESFKMARKRNKTKKYCAENAIMYVLLSSRGQHKSSRPCKLLLLLVFLCQTFPCSSRWQTFMLEKPPQYLHRQYS